MARPKPQDPKVALTISVPTTLKADFIKACEKADTNASQVLRDAMRAFIEKQAQKELF